jgi:hypothetical protein
MNITTRRRPVLVFGLLLTAAAASVLAMGVYKKTRPPQEQKEPSAYNAKLTKQDQIPQVKSKVKDLQIVGVSVSNEGTDDAALQIGITNNSDKGVLAYEFSATDGEYFANRGTDGTIDDPDNPSVVIAPHSYSTFEWSLRSIYKGMPIYLSAARFAGGSEDGDVEVLKMMKKDFERALKAKGRKK